MLEQEIARQPSTVVIKCNEIIVVLYNNVILEDNLLHEIVIYLVFTYYNIVCLNNLNKNENIPIRH